MQSRLGVVIVGLIVAFGGVALTLPNRADALRVGVFPVSGTGADALDAGPSIARPVRPKRGISPLTSGSRFEQFSRKTGAVASASNSRVPNPTEYPYSTHGKLLMSIGGGVGSCSGTVISTPNEATVVTAAHCVREGYGHRGRWAQRIAFIPAYERGQRPFGTFRASRVWVPAPYWRTENPNFDVAVIRLRKNRLGRVARVAGSRGWMANVARARRYEVFGYPAGAMRGEIPRFCLARVRGVRRITRFIPGPAPLRIRCMMARGSSGGGWIFGGRYLNSVIGFSEIGHPEFLYGAYFGRTVQRLIQTVG